MPGDTANPVRSVDRPWITFVTRADPDFYRAKRDEVEYEFTERTFKADPATRGAYGD